VEQGQRKNYYTLEAWFKNGSKFLVPIYPRDTGSNDFKLKELSSVVDNILYKHATDILPVGEKLAAHREQFVIEFFLPIQLLNEPIEQWKLPSTERMLGVDYRLVTRFCDFIRMKGGTKTNSWLYDLQCLCQKFPDILSDPSKIGINWLEQFDATDEHKCDLHRSLHDGKLFIISLFSPDKKSLPELVRSGTPFLFWARCWDDSERERLQQKFDELLRTCETLEKLPEVLLKKRRDMMSDCRKNGMSMICNLSLLWNKHDEVLSLMRSRLTAPD